ncbi:disease resistance RPP13-like protein 4 [Jatropha curcas]|uniref:disease resistance RPP13-like protein 4 n=1 Tax=Jatropha curcas TaxID=180498 RepID=UPI0018936A4B|nr:disease resistance RPP13-like protein 4 [Jatropha curcas]
MTSPGNLSNRMFHSQQNVSLPGTSFKGGEVQVENEDPETKTNMKVMTARALCNLLKGNPSICRTIIDSGALMSFIVLLDKGNKGVQYLSATALMEITAIVEEDSDVRRTTFRHSSPICKILVDQLMKILQRENQDLDLLIPCIKSIGNLAKIFRVAEARIIAPLVNLLDDITDVEVLKEALITLAKFACKENNLRHDHSKKIIKAGGAKNLISLIFFKDQIVQYSALLLLCYITLHVPNSEELVQYEVLKVLEWASKQSFVTQDETFDSLLPEAKAKLEHDVEFTMFRLLPKQLKNMEAASVILEKLADELTEAIKNQAQYAIDFKCDLENLKDKLKIVNGFFADMDKLKEQKQVLKEAWSQLRDLAYDADDILTDCMIREEYKKDGHGFSLNDPIFAYKMGRKLKDLNSRLQNVEDSMNKYLISQSQQLNKNEVRMDKGLFISQHLTLSDSLVGLEEDIRKLKKWILSENRPPLQFVGIVGMGGSGKTTLAWEIYNDKEVIDKFKQNRIWVTVSQDCDEESIINSILEELKKQQQEVTQGGDDHESFCLVILDDIWNVFNLSHWQDLCFSLDRKQGQNTCIIITTRNEEVAIGMRVNSSRIHYPKALEDEKCWLLFQKVAFSPSDDICKDENIIQVGKKIVKKCGGLPLAIKTIAALLKSKRQLKEWEKVHDEFQKLTQEKVPVMACLQLSYDALPRHLKQFLLSFSIYPKDFEIRAEQLVHWWIGEGLVKSRDSKTAMDLGYEYLADLAGRCLVEVVRRRGYDGKVHSCKMHDLVRDLTIKTAGEEALCSFESGGKQRQLIMQDSLWLGITDENISISSLSQCSKLRAILSMSSLSISSNMPISLSSLRVLDLSNGKLDDKSVENLFKWIILLKRLAHLNLSGAPGLKNVPRIRKLRNLQLLVLSGCSNLVKSK